MFSNARIAMATCVTQQPAPEDKTFERKKIGQGLVTTAG
jgi:hypothetical protein